jgi:hypothetical protein
MPKIVVTRSSVRPARSISAIVFSNVAGSGFAAMRPISASCPAMPASSAGARCSTRTRSNGGTPP